jgi:hypothetical protein
MSLRHFILRDLTETVGKRRWPDPNRIGARIRDAHPFELSAVAPALFDLAESLMAHWNPGRLAFLPFESTWLEWKTPAGGTIAFLIERRDDDRAEFHYVDERQNSHCGNFPLAPAIQKIGLDDQYIQLTPGWMKDQKDQDRAHAMVAMIYGALLLINHPKSVGRVEHKPHAGLQRRIAAAEGKPGKAYLLGETEIILRMTPQPDEREPGEPSVLVGGRALHWVRSYIRRNARLPVIEHMRGDPRYGIKKGRYSFEPEKTTRLGSWGG